VPGNFFEGYDDLPDAYEFRIELSNAIAASKNCSDSLNVTEYYDDDGNEKTIEFVNGSIAPNAAMYLTLKRIFFRQDIKKAVFINPATVSYYKKETDNKNQFDLLIPKAHLALKNGFNSFGAVILKGGEHGNTGHYVAFHAQKDAQDKISYYLIDSFGVGGLKCIAKYLKNTKQVDVTCYGTSNQTDGFSCGVHSMYNILTCAQFGFKKLKDKPKGINYEKFNKSLND